MLTIKITTSMSVRMVEIPGLPDEILTLEYRNCDYGNELFRAKTPDQRFCKTSHRVIYFKHDIANAAS